MPHKKLQLKLMIAALTVGFIAVACMEAPQKPVASVEIPKIPEVVTIPPPPPPPPPQQAVITGSTNVYTGSSSGGAVAVKPPAKNGTKKAKPEVHVPTSVLATYPADSAGTTWAGDTVKVVKIPYRQLLIPLKMPTVLKDAETKSFVIFTHRPTNAVDTNTYKQVCNQWIADFETHELAAAAAATVPNAKLMPFYWPTTTNVTSSLGCADLFGYDYAFAATVVAIIGQSAQSVGPLLVLQQGKEWMVLDISKFEPVDVQRAFVIWKRHIVSENPIGATFTLVKFREYFRTLVQMYGDTIVKYAEKATG